MSVGLADVCSSPSIESLSFFFNIAFALKKKKSVKYVKEYVNLINVVREVFLFIKVARLAFLGGYLPSLSINYVAISKDMAKKNYHNCII